jgi:deoxyribodipyrimidine photo-lyase
MCVLPSSAVVALLTQRPSAIHDPGLTLSKKELQKMGYCAPIVDHTKARIRAIARYKT